MNGWAIAFFVLLILFIWFLIVAQIRIEESTNLILMQDKIIKALEKRVEKE